MDEGDRDKTAWTSKYGQFRYLRMPLCLSNSGATLQRLIDLVLSGISHTNRLAYIDDIIVVSKIIEEHFDRLLCVLDRVVSAGLKCLPDKCIFLRPSVFSRACGVRQWR